MDFGSDAETKFLRCVALSCFTTLGLELYCLWHFILQQSFSETKPKSCTCAWWWDKQGCRCCIESSKARPCQNKLPLLPCRPSRPESWGVTITLKGHAACFSLNDAVLQCISLWCILIQCHGLNHVWSAFFLFVLSLSIKRVFIGSCRAEPIYTRRREQASKCSRWATAATR